MQLPTSILMLVVYWGPAAEGRPNIVFILADDLGWGDVGWNNPSMADVTPHLTKLARSGMVLSQYYVQQVCSPSRAALLTGLYPFHTGRQKGTIKPLQPTGLTLKHSLLSDSLKSLGYRTHMVGKWHLGFCKSAYLPTHRGFNTFSGYYTGAEHYFSHVRDKGYDFRRNDNVDFGARGNYSTDLFNQEAVRIVENEKGTKPFFLYLAYQATHAPLEAPVDEFRKTRATGNPERDVYRAMLARMDSGVGELVAALKRRGLWGNTILVFSTDNGGAVSMAGSNFPLRGTKGTLFEGGTRGAGFIAGGQLRQRGAVSGELMHITDWMPTLLSLAGGRPPQGIDGVDHSGLVRQGRSASKRTTVVYNLKIKPVTGAVRVGDFKLMFAPHFNKDGWYNPDARPRKMRMVMRRKRMRRRQRRPNKTKRTKEEKEEQKRTRKEKEEQKRTKMEEKEERKRRKEDAKEEDAKPKRRRRRRMVSPTLLARNTELEKLFSGQQDDSFEADDTEMGMAMHSLEENELKRAEKRRKLKSGDEEEEEDDDDDEEEEKGKDDDDEEEEDDDKIEFDELEEPVETSDVKTTLSNRKHLSEIENVEASTDLPSLKSTLDGKLQDAETLRGGNPGLQPMGDEESMKTKVKVKKRNIMFRADRNEFPEFDSEGDNRVTSERKKVQKETNVPENIDENQKKPKEKKKGKDDEITEVDLSSNGEAMESEKKLTKKKKKKMRRIRVKVNDRLGGTIKVENEEEGEELKDPPVQKKRKKKCKNRKSEHSEVDESESDMAQNESEFKSKKCGGGGAKKKKKNKVQSRYPNVKETKKRAFVKNLRVIGRQFNVRPSSSGFYGKDRDWSDRPSSRNISQTPIEVFNSAWPKLNKHLFNVRLDPEERNDLAASRPDVLEQLREKVVELLRTFVARDYPAPSNKGRPNRFNNVWSPGWC